MPSFKHYLGPLGSEDLLTQPGLEISESTETIARETRLASGLLVRDVVAVKRVWSLSWEEIPGKTTDTHDGGLGKDALQALVFSGALLSLEVPIEAGGTEQVDVQVKAGSFKSKLIRATSSFIYQVSMVLVEV